MSKEATSFSHAQLELLRPFLAPEYAELDDTELTPHVAASLEGLSAEEVEAFFKVLEEVNWGKVVSGALSGAATGASVGSVVPGWGTLIGGIAGLIGGGLAGGLGGSRKKPPPRQPSPRRPGPPRAPAPRPTPSRPPSRPVAGGGQRPPSRPPSRPRSPGGPAAAIMAALQNPQVVRAIVSGILGVLGKREFQLGPHATPVTRAEILGMLEVLSGLAADAVSDLDPKIGETRIDGSSVDPANPDEQAMAVLELVLSTPPEARQEAGPETEGEGVETDSEEESAGSSGLFDRPPALISVRGKGTAFDEAAPAGPDVLSEASEAIIRKIDADLSALAQFRRAVRNTEEFPYSAICQLKIQMTGSGGGFGIGTGFYVAPDLILTAGHCVAHAKYGRAVRIIVRPGRDGSEEPFGRFEVRPSQMVAHPRWLQDLRSADYDLAVLRVSHRAPGGRFFALAPVPGGRSGSLAVCGYAAQRSAGVDPDRQNIDYDTVRDLGDQSFTYSLHTTGGTSGSPVFLTSGRTVTAVGVHSRTAGDSANRACRLTPSKVDWIRAAGRRDAAPLPGRFFGGMDPETEPDLAVSEAYDEELEGTSDSAGAVADASGRWRVEVESPVVRIGTESEETTRAPEAIVRKLNGDTGALARFRAGVSDTRVFPYSAICHLRFQMGGRWYMGTGFYIAPTAILTAAHNVIDRVQGKVTHMTVTPALNGSREPFGHFNVPPASIFPHPDWNHGEPADHDVAVMRARQRAPGGRHFAIQELSMNPVSGILVAGYAAESGADPTRQNVDRDSIRRILGGSFTYSLHTTRGTSGSPVFYTRGRDVIAVGVHSRSYDATTNRATRLTAEILRWIRRTLGRESMAVAALASHQPWSEEAGLDLIAG